MTGHDERASRQDWAMEAMRLQEIATAAAYYVQPHDCTGGGGCHHDDDVCIRMEERYATAADAIAAARVPSLEFPVRYERVDLQRRDTTGGAA